MKKAFVYLSLITISVFAYSCRFEDASAGVADDVVGKYTVQKIQDSKNTINLPTTTQGVTVTARIDISKKGAAIVDIRRVVYQKSAAKTDSTTQTDIDVNVAKSGSTYTFTIDGKEIGNLKDKTLTLESVVNKEKTTVIAEKQ
ncbi:MAG: hypothetical protein MUF45_06290 [Spirosomaceae bacterium]|nr:hypothetical protein [Spirosomataceae bacterium]